MIPFCFRNREWRCSGDARIELASSKHDRQVGWSHEQSTADFRGCALRHHYCWRELGCSRSKRGCCRPCRLASARVLSQSPTAIAWQMDLGREPTNSEALADVRFGPRAFGKKSRSTLGEFVRRISPWQSRSMKRRLASGLRPPSPGLCADI